MIRVIVLVLLLLAPMSSNLFAARKRAAANEVVVVEEQPQQIEAVDFTDNVFSKMLSYYKLGIDEKLYIQLDKPYYSAGDRIWFKGYLRNAITHEPLDVTNFMYAEIIDRDDQLVTRVKVQRDSVAGFNGYINLDAQMDAGDYTFRAYTQWMLNHGDDYLFSRAIQIVSPIPPTMSGESDEKEQSARKSRKEAAESIVDSKLNFDLQFLPEGGALLAGNSQIVAFKAVGEDGLSVEVTGEIYNSKDTKIAEFNSAYKGMGITTMFVDGTEQYYAKATSNEGKELRVDLPAVESIGATITATKIGDKLLFQPHTTDLALLESAHVVIHSHGQVVSVTNVQGTATNSISMSRLVEGVNVVSLVDAAGEVLSERLIFKRPDYTPSIDIESDRSRYASRDKVVLNLHLQDTLQGEFGISVTDDSSVEFNPADENILSYLLLSSDLKGHIEDPGLYFSMESETEADYYLDLLMRTQGWSRFDLGDVLSESVPQRDLLYESYASISGNVKSFWGNDAKQPKLYVLCGAQNFFDEYELDESSQFNLVGLNIPDSTTYVVQAKGRKGGNAYTLNINPEPLPEPKSTIYARAESVEAYVPVAFINQSQDKFYYEGGMTMINIDAISVTTSVKDNLAGIEGVFATRSTGREELDMMSNADMTTLMMSYASMTVTSESVTFRSNTSPAMFMVDGMEMEFTDITYLTAADIERIDFYDGVEALIYNPVANGGVFVIELRTDFEGFGPPTNIAHVSHLGYQKLETFYQPNYAVASLKENLPPDYRTTIYWDGSLRPDENGNIEVEFYAADKPTTYTVTVEGMSDTGLIYRSTSTLERR